MQLAPIQLSQFTQWKAMRKAIYPVLDDRYDEQEMKQIVGHPDWFCYFLTDADGTLLGLVELSSRNIVDGCLSSPVAYIEGLYLKPEYRHQGLGKEVIQLLRSWCRERSFSELATDTQLANEAAQRFYRAAGFQETDRVVEFRIQID